MRWLARLLTALFPPRTHRSAWEAREDLIAAAARRGHVMSPLAPRPGGGWFSLCARAGCSAGLSWTGAGDLLEHSAFVWPCWRAGIIPPAASVAVRLTANVWGAAAEPRVYVPRPPDPAPNPRVGKGTRYRGRR